VSFCVLVYSGIFIIVVRLVGLFWVYFRGVFDVFCLFSVSVLVGVNVIFCLELVLVVMGAGFFCCVYDRV